MPMEVAKTLSEQGVALRGCTPTPLSDYLKALGLLRLVSEQADSAARGMWVDETFKLITALDEDAVVAFFLDKYRPTPIIAPWNRGSGFWGKKASAAALAAVAASTSPRFLDYRLAIDAARQTIEGLGLSLDSKPDKKQKQDLMRLCRATVPDAAVQWLDAAFVLGEDKPKYPALLGTGANDGNMDFTANFMQNLAVVLDLDPDAVRPQGRSAKGSKRSTYDRVLSEGFLRDALFGNSTTPLTSSAIGQFNPGAVGGPNGTRGFEAGSLLNPWDFVLALEGSLVFAGSVVWRLNASSRGMAAFPFTVDASAAGWGSASEDGLEARAETWAPMWSRPSSYRELSRLFSEGRAQVGRRRAQNGTDFARAVAGLGVDRGISGFVRYGFMRRSGLAYLSVPLGRLKVAERPAVNLIDDLDHWLDPLRRVASDAKGPASYRRSLRQVEDAVFAYCTSGDRQDLVRVLVAVGRGERALALGGRTRKLTRPLQNLRDDWADECGGSPEFRLALSLASIADPKVGPLRSNLEPVEMDKGRWKWASDSGSATQYGSDLVRGLADILKRRSIMGSRAGLAQVPICGGVAVSPDDVALFLSGRVDDAELLDLLWALTAMKTKKASDVSLSRTNWPGRTSLASVPRAYALLKLLMLPAESVALIARAAGEDTTRFRLPPEPAILSRLGAGDPAAALEIAVRRLRACGLVPIASGQSGHMQVPDFVLSPNERNRLAAALLFPVTDVESLAKLVIRF